MAGDLDSAGLQMTLAGGRAGVNGHAHRRRLPIQGVLQDIAGDRFRHGIGFDNLARDAPPLTGKQLEGVASG